MEIKHITLILVMLILSACTSSTRSVTNPALNSKPEISPVISMEMKKSLKRIVAISRFSDETKRGNSFLVDQNSNRIGKQASDILSARLTESGKFLMLERSDLYSLKNENKLQSKEFSVIGAQFLILGSVSEYGRSSESDVGIFSRNKIQKANVTVNVRLVDTKTSQVVFSEEATGEARTEANKVFGVGKSAGYDTSLDDKALSAAISKLVSNIMENLLDSPWEAYLLNKEGEQMYMTGGKEQGIKIGDIFQVLAKGKQIKNPQTGQLIELPGNKTAKIRVTGFIGSGENALSITVIESGVIHSTKLKNYIVREIKGN